jgi:hypothetical protein
MHRWRCWSIPGLSQRPIRTHRRSRAGLAGWRRVAVGCAEYFPEDIMSNGELHAREREDLALHVERCAERYTAVRAEICGLRKQTRRIEGAIWGIVAVLIALGAGGAQILPILRALSRAAGG